MDTRTGELMSHEEMIKRIEENPELEEFIKPAPNVSNMMLKKMKVGRNQKCPCGSNKKFKKCCMIELLINKY